MKLTPILTEKSLAEAKKGHYTFWAGFGMDKNQIRKLVEKVFEVHVVAIRTINLKGGEKRNFKGQEQKIKNRKKAIVDLKGDEKIDVFEGKKNKK